jgi:hypothetical protein
MSLMKTYVSTQLSIYENVAVRVSSLRGANCKSACRFSGWNSGGHEVFTVKGLCIGRSLPSSYRSAFKAGGQRGQSIGKV